MVLAGGASHKRLSVATTYEEWSEIAQELDEKSGALRWKQEEKDTRYDYRRIRERLDMLRHARETGDERELLFALNEGIHGNLGGIARPALYNQAIFGTKDLITNYMVEVENALNHLAEVSDEVIPFEERIDFFRRASHCFGRSALMLSGAGSLAPFHIGTIKALHQEGLLPDVISGSSGGAFVAAAVGTRSPEELDAIFEGDAVIDSLYSDYEQEDPSIWPQQLSISTLSRAVEDAIPDLTFEEAYEKSKIYINISVAPTKSNQKSRLLNVFTAPHVFVREAVIASCSVPGVFPPVHLAAKNYDGARKPYLPEMTWIDGSVSDDLPRRRLGRIYSVNHFIASQTNPAILWAVRDTNAESNLVRTTLDWWDQIFKANLRASRPFVRYLTKQIPGMSSLTHMMYSVALQEYTADVNIIPSRRLFDPRKILAQISPEETLALIADGERSAWPKIELIRNSTRISKCLDTILDEYEHEAERQHSIPRRQKRRRSPTTRKKAA